MRINKHDIDIIYELLMLLNLCRTDILEEDVLPKIKIIFNDFQGPLDDKVKEVAENEFDDLPSFPSFRNALREQLIVCISKRVVSTQFSFKEDFSSNLDFKAIQAKKK